jgi:hypothetical protein
MLQLAPTVHFRITDLENTLWSLKSIDFFRYSYPTTSTALAMGETSPNARQLAATLETSSNALSPTLRTREIEQPPAQSSTIAVGEDVWKEKIRPDADLLDVGWEKDHGQLAEHLVEGLENEDVWRLIRRFNKVRRQLLSLPERPVTPKQ